MKIAALVHNGVLNDARVIKEAISLRRAGHEITLHGISPTDLPQHHILPTSDIEVFLEPRAVPAGSVLERLLYGGLPRVGRAGQWLVAAIAAAFFWLLWPVLVGRIAILSGGDGWPVTTGLVMIALVLGLVSLRAGQKWLTRAGTHAAARLRQGRDNVRAVLEARRPALIGRVYRDITDALLASLARCPAPEAIHLHDHIALSIADRLKARYGVPLVWDAHEIYQAMAGGNPQRARAHARIIAARHIHLDFFITINASIARFYQEHYPRMPAARVLMNATDPAPLPRYDGRLHTAAGLPAAQKILLFQGVLGVDRGLPQLIAAAAAFPPEWSLVIMGWGDLEAPLRVLAARHLRPGAPPAVVFLPGVAQVELQQWTAGATLGAIPYENSNLNHLYCTPNKLWEYPSAGVPVLCTDLVEMTAMIECHGFGFLLPRDFDAHDIAALVGSLDDAALAQARDNCARFLAANNWSTWEHNLLSIYTELERPRPAVARLSRQ